MTINVAIRKARLSEQQTTRKPAQLASSVPGNAEALKRLLALGRYVPA